MFLLHLKRKAPNPTCPWASSYVRGVEEGPHNIGGVQNMSRPPPTFPIHFLS